MVDSTYVFEYPRSYAVLDLAILVRRDDLVGRIDIRITAEGNDITSDDTGESLGGVVGEHIRSRGERLEQVLVGIRKSPDFTDDLLWAIRVVDLEEGLFRDDQAASWDVDASDHTLTLAEHWDDIDIDRSGSWLPVSPQC